MDNSRASFPTAARLLRFIRAATEDFRSPVVQMASFVEKAHREIGGPWWAGKASVRSSKAKALEPYSMLGEMVRTYLPHLMGDAIMPVVEPSGLGTRGEAKMMQLRLRRWVDDTGYQDVDEGVVMDALCGVGVQYVSLNAGGPMFSDGSESIDAGTPVVSRVPVSRLVVSPDADALHLAPEVGHWIEVDRGAMLEAGVGDPSVLERIPNVWQESAASSGRSKGRKVDSEDVHLRDTIRLWELCFRWRNRWFCCTLPPENGIDGFVVPPYELDGEPEGSRYVFTQLGGLPDSPIPVSPAMVLMDAHMQMRTVMAKLMEQIDDLRREYVVKSGAQQMVLRMMQGTPEGVTVGDPSAISEFVFGGMVKDLVEARAMLEAVGDRIGPNVRMSAGAEDPSNTATGTSVLAGNAGVVLGYSRKKIDAGRTAVMRRVASMLSRSYERMEFEVPLGPGMSMPVVWEPAAMRLSYDQLKYRIKPSSNVSGMDARARLRSMAELFQTIPGMVQIVMGLGGDPAKVIRVLSDLSESPELDEILPTPDFASIQMQVLASLGQSGKLGSAGGQLPASGPMTQSAQLQSDASRAIPA